MPGLAYGSAILLKTAQQSFWNTYTSYSDPFEGTVDRRESTQQTDTYTRLGAAPMPVPFVGEREAKDANEYSYSATNTPFDSTIRIDKNLIKYQQWDEVARLIGNQGNKAAAHRVSLMSAAINVGHSTVCEDGQFFYDTDHSDPGAEYTTSQDNDLTANATAAENPTDLEAAAAVRALVNSIMSRKDDRGDPFEQFSENPGDWVLMVPTNLYSQHRRVLVSPQITGPLGNDVMGRFTLRVNPFLTLATATDGDGMIFMFYTGGAHKALILQETGGTEYNVYKDPHSDDWLSSATWWGAVTYGNYRTSARYQYT